MVFLSTAVVTATYAVKSHIPDIPALRMPVLDNLTLPPEIFAVGSVIIALYMIGTENTKSFISKVTLFLVGAVFGFGLIVAGMTMRSKIYGFLVLDSNWDPSLLFVLMTGVLINAFTFNIILNFVYFCP